MARRLLSRWQRLSARALAALAAGPGCDYSGGVPAPVPQGIMQEGAAPVAPVAPTVTGGTVPSAAGAPSPTAAGAVTTAEERGEERAAILDNVVKQIQAAAVTPGGNHFGNATRNLNQYFAGTPKAAYALDPRARAFLEIQLPPKRVDEFETAPFILQDARHIEDCMMYQGIAQRVAGAGDDLTRARRVFDWMVRQVQLVPAGSLGAPGMGQAFARPFDVLLRGLATESEGMWSERGWLFLSLCRQLGLDAGMVTYTPPNVKDPVVWCCAVLIEGKAYLFDQRIGMPVPDAGGEGVATLQEALDDPVVLARLDLPGLSPYGTTRDALRGSPTKVGILIDSGFRYFSPRMKLLQESLAGKNQTILFRNPADQRDAWLKALGPVVGKVALWDLPMTVETLLFTNPQFTELTKRALILFRPEFPLLYARMKQLRGETADAVRDYVAFRFAVNSTLMDKKTPMPKEVQGALDVYATYFLATAHLELNDPKQAEFFFEKTLGLVPEPGRGQPYYNMYRWGALTNLGRLMEAKGEAARAIAYESAPYPTSQRHGNLLRARDLVWKAPAAEAPAALPPAPPPAGAPGSATASR